MPYLHNRVLDNGLNVVTSEASDIYLCSQEPATYTEASATYALAQKDFGAGNAFGAPGDRTPNGRKVTSVAVTDGTVTDTDDATHWAVVDDVNSRLLAANALNASQAVTSGNVFTLAAFDLGIPAAVSA